MNKNSTTTTTPVYRSHKDRVYTMIFSDKSELLALYNAANKTNYDNPDMLEINTLEEAVDKAICECINEGILAKFLRKNRAEVKKMSIYEYNEEEVKKAFREDGLEDGLAKGRMEGRTQGIASSVIKLLEERCEVPAALEEEIYGESDITILFNWLRLAAEVTTVDEFKKRFKTY